MNTFWQEVSIQTHAFDLALEERDVRQHAADAGALVAFQGMVRAFDHEATLDYLFLQHYPGVTESEIGRIIDEAASRFSLSAARVIHRVGELRAGEAIVLVIACARHRQDAFSGAELIMDYLKTQAPFWKREHLNNGEQHWVQAKTSDAQAAQRWQPLD